MKLFLNALFLYVPAATISIMYYFSMVYVSNFRHYVGIKSSSLPVSTLHIVEASAHIFLDNWILIVSFLLLVFIIMYKLLASSWFKENQLPAGKTSIAALIFIAPFLFLIPLFFLVTVLGVSDGEATRVKEQINNKDNLSTITLNGEVVAKGVIVGMSDSIVWIYDGTSTTGMQIGNHKIITPVTAKNEQTAN